MPQLFVKKKLNKRSKIPATLPQLDGIVEPVPRGHRFWGTLVKGPGLPPPPLDKWYQDEKGFYYWAEALDVISTGTEKLLTEQWWQRSLQLNALQKATLSFITDTNPVNIAVFDSGLANIDNIPDDFNVVGKRNFFLDNEDIIDLNSGHGTLCSSLIAAESDTFKGINSKAKLFIAKIIHRGDCIAKAINFIADNNDHLQIDIISYSGGVPDEQNIPSLQQAIEKAISKSIIIICAIGNKAQTNTGFFPALNSKVISVGALNSNNTYSTINPDTSKIDICLPGENIHGINVLKCSQEFDGTSQACAIAAGITSLVLAKAKSTNKKWNSDDLKAFYAQCSESFTAPTGFTMQRINSNILLEQIEKI